MGKYTVEFSAFLWFLFVFFYLMYCAISLVMRKNKKDMSKTIEKATEVVEEIKEQKAHNDEEIQKLIEENKKARTFIK